MKQVLPVLGHSKAEAWEQEEPAGWKPALRGFTRRDTGAVSLHQQSGAVTGRA